MLKSIFIKIMSNDKQREKMNSLKDQKQIYDLFRANGYTKSYNNFKKEMDSFLNSKDSLKITHNDFNDISDEMLEMVAGGTNIKLKAMSLSLAALMATCCAVSAEGDGTSKQNNTNNTTSSHSLNDAKSNNNNIINSMSKSTNKSGISNSNKTNKAINLNIKTNPSSQENKNIVDHNDIFKNNNFDSKEKIESSAKLNKSPTNYLQQSQQNQNLFENKSIIKTNSPIQDTKKHNAKLEKDERDRLEKERKDKEEKAKKDKERKEQERKEQERKEQERKEQEEKAKKDKEKLEREEKEANERQQKLENERLEKEIRQKYTLASLKINNAIAEAKEWQRESKENDAAFKAFIGNDIDNLNLLHEQATNKKLTTSSKLPDQAFAKGGLDIKAWEKFITSAENTANKINSFLENKQNETFDESVQEKAYNLLPLFTEIRQDLGNLHMQVEQDAFKAQNNDFYRELFSDLAHDIFSSFGQTPVYDPSQATPEHLQSAKENLNEFKARYNDIKTKIEEIEKTIKEKGGSEKTKKEILDKNMQEYKEKRQERKKLKEVKDRNLKKIEYDHRNKLRKEYEKNNEILKKQITEKEQKATKIQSTFRGHKARKDVERQKISKNFTNDIFNNVIASQQNNKNLEEQAKLEVEQKRLEKEKKEKNK